ncbi:MAG: bifunctional riboflavin kinase/FAD synthetase [Planctomycetaceae bacterium]
MKLVRGFKNPECYRRGFVSIGNFDGVHRGHQTMIAALVRNAKQASVPSVVMTFDPHPIALLRPEHTPPNLCTVEHKVELLTRFGVDCVIVYPTDREFLQLSPIEFFDNVVRRELEASGLVEGPNFYFGHDRQGNVATLRELCDAAGVELEVISPVVVGSCLVSSSAIRSQILAGSLASAVEMLGHPFRIRGTVVHGAERGRTIGFPTANLSDVATLLPADGVYAGIVRLDERSWRAAVHIGSNPTFGESGRKLEVHLLDFQGDLYHRTLDVDLVDRVRGTEKFSGAEALKKQLLMDVAKVREIVPLSDE